MSGLEALAAFGVLLCCACSSGGDGDGDNPGAASGGGSVFGDAPPSRDPVTATRIATRTVEATVTSCGGGCSADVRAGHASLREGKMLEAWNAFKCADTPEAAFGAGIARVLGVLESDAGDAVMADFGLAPLPASDVFGPSGLLARQAARWNGDAQLTIAGGLSLQIDSGHVTADDYELEVSIYDGPRNARFSIDTDLTLAPGTVIAPQYNCAAAGGRTQGVFPYVHLTVRGGDDGDIFCQLPFALPAAVCTPDGGSLQVVANGARPGDRVAYELSELLLDCSQAILSDDPNQSDVERPLAPVRVSGRFEAQVVLEVDTSGLHRIFQDDDGLLLSSVPAKVTSSTLMNHAAAVAGEIASARCYFAKAAEGSGTVFTLPGAVYGGQDVALGPGDARMLAAASGAAAAAIELATSYEFGLSTEQLACWLDDGLDAVAKCGTSSEFVAALNRFARTAETRHDRLGAARALLEVALDDFETGVAQLDENSALVRDQVSAPGWDLALELARAAQGSLAGRTAIPHIWPVAHLDLKSFFASPPDPRAMSQPLLALSEDCGEGGIAQQDCTREIDLEIEYLDAFFAPHSDFDWEGEYEWQGGDEIETALEQIGAQLRSRGFTFED
jgi:hypothetical protein